MRLLAFISFLCLLVPNLIRAELVNGPMLAHVAMREAKVWVQADAPSIARIHYTDVTNAGAGIWTVPVETEANRGHTAVLTLDQVEPGTRYRYYVELNGERVGQEASFSTLENYFDRSPAPDFRFAVGGAHYVTEDGFEPPYRTLGGGYDIFTSIAAQEPALMLWTGNTAHLRPADWSTRSGYLKRFTKARSVSQLGPLLESIPHYATWSTSDYGAPGGNRLSSTREIAEDSFTAFWPRPVKVAQLDGIATQFRYADVDFFLLDVRSHRNDTPDSSSSVEILGDAQIEWLRQALIQSTATFKIIVAGAPILNPADSRENLSYAEREHTNFLQMMRDERISGLFFLSGGKPYGELTKLVHANSYSLYDLTLGPLTAEAGERGDELNFFRSPGTSTFERHFALIECTGDESERALTIRVLSMEGKELWNRRIPASELQVAD
jgi:alkaline phosphatase D